jgi:hypothetical protein
MIAFFLVFVVFLARFIAIEFLVNVKSSQHKVLVQKLVKDSVNYSKIALFLCYLELGFCLLFCIVFTILTVVQYNKNYLITLEQISVFYVWYHYQARIVFLQFLTIFIVARFNWLISNPLTNQQAFFYYHKTIELIELMNESFGLELFASILCTILVLGLFGFESLHSEFIALNLILNLTGAVSILFMCCGFQILENKIEKRFSDFAIYVKVSCLV